MVNVTKYDRGVYRCYAQNNVGMAAFYDAFLKIRFPPTAQPLRVGGYYGQGILLDVNTVIINKYYKFKIVAPDRAYDVMLECITSGYPDPDVDFYMQGVKDPLKDSTRYEIEKLVPQGMSFLKWDDRIFTLRIRQVISTDYGNYFCVATNKYGSSNCSMEFFCTVVSLLSRLRYSLRRSAHLSGRRVSARRRSRCRRRSPRRPAPSADSCCFRSFGLTALIDRDGLNYLDLRCLLY